MCTLSLAHIDLLTRDIDVWIHGPCGLRPVPVYVYVCDILTHLA